MAEKTVTAEQAREILDQIKQSVHNLSDLIRFAWESKAWEAAGYQTWESCCQSEFPELRVNPDQRLRVVGELVGSGMSDHAIAVALRVSRPTVSSTREKLSGGKYLPPDNVVVGRDGKKYGRTYVSAEETRQLLNRLREERVSIKTFAEEAGVQYQMLYKVKSGYQATISKPYADAVKETFISRLGADSLPVDGGGEVAEVVSIHKKTGPQLSAARAEARHTLVNAAITMQKAARQLGMVQPQYLQFGQNDRELDQAPQIIADAIKLINQTMKGIEQ